jgi:uncharacterized protein YndB with AHSA1/START domain
VIPSQPEKTKAAQLRTFQVSVDIAAPPQRVWAVTTDVEHWPEWTESVVSARRLDSGPFRVGSRARIRQPGFLPALWEVTELDPGRSFTWVTSGPGMRAAGYHGVEAIPSGSRATLSVTFEGLLGGLVSSLMARTTERFLGLEAVGLKKRSESATARLA